MERVPHSDSFGMRNDRKNDAFVTPDRKIKAPASVHPRLPHIAGLIVLLRVQRGVQQVRHQKPNCLAIAFRTGGVSVAKFRSARSVNRSFTSPGESCAGARSGSRQRRSSIPRPSSPRPPSHTADWCDRREVRESLGDVTVQQDFGLNVIRLFSTLASSRSPISPLACSRMLCRVTSSILA